MGETVRSNRPEPCRPMTASAVFVPIGVVPLSARLGRPCADCVEKVGSQPERRFGQPSAEKIPLSMAVKCWRRAGAKTQLERILLRSGTMDRAQVVASDFSKVSVGSIPCPTGTTGPLDIAGMEDGGGEWNEGLWGKRSGSRRAV